MDYFFMFRRKRDTTERIVQSKNILKIVEESHENILICGDFNLSLQTSSLSLLEKEGNLTNWIKQEGVESTRSSLYEKPERHADYVFSKGFKGSLSVPDLRVSDHLR